MRLIFDNILVIDDDEIGTHLNCSIIKKLGIARHVINKKNGQEAIDYIKMQSERKSKEIMRKNSAEIQHLFIAHAV
jgi:hypothetical protein